MARLDFSIEPLVREAFASAVGRDLDRSAAAFQAMGERGDETTQACYHMMVAVTTFALMDLHGGSAPRQEQLDYLTDTLVDMEAWADISRDTARLALTALSEMKPLESVVSPSDALWLIHIIGAWLMSAFGPEERHWWQYLDQILHVLEQGQAHG